MRTYLSLLPISALLLSGCASFSPDSGMTVVSEVAKETLKKEVAFVRSADDAERTSGAVKRPGQEPRHG
jgi:PBP1b-binding outer membrane lipoprotein LpoB